MFQQGFDSRLKKYKNLITMDNGGLDHLFKYWRKSKRVWCFGSNMTKMG